jgi:putative ABC transport system permease protein
MFQPVRMARMLLTVSAILAFGLCAVGLYGVLALAVTQRTREIGVRIAIGASRLQIVALVLGDAAAVIAVGLGVGLVLAWNSTQLVTSLLFGISAHDAVAFAAAPIAIVTMAGLASYVPALRAVRVSPLAALREE